jgi:hypothetical protein
MDCGRLATWRKVIPPKGLVWSGNGGRHPEMFCPLLAQGGITHSICSPRYLLTRITIAKNTFLRHGGVFRR